MVTPARVGDEREIVYDEERWSLFRALRDRARQFMEVLREFDPVVHGSVARGDVDKDSDIDVFIPRVVPSYRIELTLQREFGIQRRELVMATPWQLPKAHVYLDEKCSVTFPMVKPRQTELEFYYFGGAADLSAVAEGKRVPGVDKRLMLILPTPEGHVERPIIGQESEVATILGISIEIVRQRIQVLSRRAAIGHTGLFIQRELGTTESFEEVFKSEILENPAARLRLKAGE